MKINKTTKQQPIFKPYSKTIKIMVESKDDERLLEKLKEFASNEDVFLADRDSREITDICFTRDQEDSANLFINDLLKSL